MKRPLWKWLLGSMLIWALINLLPYAITGETWGLVWYSLNLPLSDWLKATPITDVWYPPLFVITTTLINSSLVGLLVMGLRSMRRS